MEISAFALFLLGCIFVIVLVRVKYYCDARAKDDMKADMVVKELAGGKTHVDEIEEEALKQAVSDGKIYMVGYKQEGFTYHGGLPLYYPPALRINSYPYGGYPVGLYSNLYDWKPYTYYGGLWFNRSYTPIVFNDGSWRMNNDVYYYILN